MNVELTSEELDVLLTSLEYSKRNLRDTQGTPYEVQRENITRVELVMAKLREARQESNRES